MRNPSRGVVVTAALGLAALVLSFLLADPTAFLNRYYGRVQSKDLKNRYLGHGGLNNGHCWINHGSYERYIHGHNSLITPDKSEY